MAGPGNGAVKGMDDWLTDRAQPGDHRRRQGGTGQYVSSQEMPGSGAGAS
jgi:hypothetical protein